MNSTEHVTSVIFPCANLPTFGLFRSPQGQINPEQLPHAASQLQVKIFGGSNPTANAAPCLLMVPELLLYPGAPGKLSAVFVFTWLWADSGV